MTSIDIDRYFAALDEPTRGTLEEMRRRILQVVPDAEQCISYTVPAFKVEGTTIAGLAAFKTHLSYLPHSGSVLPRLQDELAGYERTKSALHFGFSEPLPQSLIGKLIAATLQERGLG